MIKILFVCHGNICRSPMAEYIMKHKIKTKHISGVEIASAATSTEELGNDIYPPAKEKLRQKGIPFERRSARRITRKDYDYYDLIVGMDDYNVRNMERILGGDPEGKIKTLLPRSVADPWYTGDFEATWQDVLAGCRGLLEKYK